MDQNTSYLTWFLTGQLDFLSPECIKGNKIENSGFKQTDLKFRVQWLDFKKLRYIKSNLLFKISSMKILYSN